MKRASVRGSRSGAPDERDPQQMLAGAERARRGSRSGRGRCPPASLTVRAATRVVPSRSPRPAPYRPRRRRPPRASTSSAIGVARRRPRRAGHLVTARSGTVSRGKDAHGRAAEQLRRQVGRVLDLAVGDDDDRPGRGRGGGQRGPEQRAAASGDRVRRARSGGTLVAEHPDVAPASGRIPRGRPPRPRARRGSATRRGAPAGGPRHRGSGSRC